MESNLDVIDEDYLSFGDSEDDEMIDIKGGQVVAEEVKEPAKNAGKKRRKRRKNKRKKDVPRSEGVNVNRFVVDVCKKLKVRKSYLVYTAVAVMGVLAVKDLVQEVEVIQSSGGQKTVRGDQYRSGGGILWNLLEAREPNVYKEIMQKGRDFEKQFKRPSVQPPSASDAKQAITSKPVGSTTGNDCEIEIPANATRCCGET